MVKQEMMEWVITSILVKGFFFNVTINLNSTLDKLSLLFNILKTQPRPLTLLSIT